MPDAVMQRLLDSVEHATEVCVATPVVVTGFAEKFYECVRIGESASLEMILPAQVFEQVHAAFPTLTNELMNDGTCACIEHRSRFRSGSGLRMRTRLESWSSLSKGWPAFSSTTLSTSQSILG